MEGELESAPLTIFQRLSRSSIMLRRRAEWRARALTDESADWPTF